MSSSYVLPAQAFARVDFHVHTLRLVRPPAPEIETFAITLQPLLTSKPLRTKRIARPSGAAAQSHVMSVDYAESLELLTGSIGARRLKAALSSERESDALVVVTLWGCALESKDAEEGPPPMQPLAEGTISVREIWTAGADLVRSALPLFREFRYPGTNTHQA